ncbi:MAG: hypothetical protein FWH37_05440 [Candidatus Bathyarchaeota archaeon]|nr:hypothetical protein [Candidatus Termiticorpusculum sp.]
MSLSEVELEILENMLLNCKPMLVTQIVSEPKDVSATNMYLAGLTQKGYVDSPQKELYTLTDEGKKALGIQPITKEIAKNIIAYAPHDKSFNFYVDTDKSLHIHAHSLHDFVNKLSKIDLKIIEFHINRNDFETWFERLGDQELAKKTAIIKKRKVTGEQLRVLLQTTVEQHCQKLMELTEQPHSNLSETEQLHKHH